MTKRRAMIRPLLYASLWIGGSTAVLLYVFFGTLTAIIPNAFFTRMMIVHWYDYLFLVFTAGLSGIYVGFWYYDKKSLSCDYTAMSGTVGGVLSFGCAMCNQFIMYTLGAVGVMTYFVPLQPVFGMLSIGLLSYAIWRKWTRIEHRSGAA